MNKYTYTNHKTDQVVVVLADSILEADVLVSEPLGLKIGLEKLPHVSCSIVFDFFIRQVDGYKIPEVV